MAELQLDVHERVDLLTKPVQRLIEAPGPYSQFRQRMTLAVYGSLLLLGSLPSLLAWSPAWQTFGLGLWFPGAGFIALGGWWLLLIPASLALMWLAVIAWFWAGAFLVLALAWVFPALAAGLVADSGAVARDFLVAGLLVAGSGAYLRIRANRRQKRRLELAAQRKSSLEKTVVRVNEMAAKRCDPNDRELDRLQLSSVRYLFDRALQPIDEWNGFNHEGDQFQPGAVRYQLNNMGYAFGVLQGTYAPNFSGYLGRAQRNLIEKYLLRKVWGYWVYESMWGHFNFTDFDPCGKDNIMLTGWFGAQVGQYMLNSGDRRYTEPGSLTFRLNDRTAYRHCLGSINQGIAENYDHYKNQFGLYSCEPTWIYPTCNFYGMASLGMNDRLSNSAYRDRLLEMWLGKLDAEFTDAAGSIVSLRNGLTGFTYPFPTRGILFAQIGNAFMPERARRLWAASRAGLEECLQTTGHGREHLVLPGSGYDRGLTRPEYASAYARILAAAHEFGDLRIAKAAQASLDLQFSSSTEAGVRVYPTVNNDGNILAIFGNLVRTGDIRQSMHDGPGDRTLSGPMLFEADYPDVLIAKARSADGQSLDLVLHSGSDGKSKSLGFNQLEPLGRYALLIERTGAASEKRVASANSEGVLRIEVDISDRTQLTLQPTAA